MLFYFNILNVIFVQLCYSFWASRRATLVNELVGRGEKMLRDGLGSPNSNPSKLNDSICAQLCDAGLEALARATRYESLFYKRSAVFLLRE